MCVSQMFTPETCLQSVHSFSIFLVSRNADILRVFKVKGTVFGKETSYSCDLSGSFFLIRWPESSIKASFPLENQSRELPRGPCWEYRARHWALG